MSVRTLELRSRILLLFLVIGADSKMDIMEKWKKGFNYI